MDEFATLRSCEQRGCIWRGAHIENCPECFGWGNLSDGSLIIGSTVAAWRSEWIAVECPVCGGTPLGNHAPR